MANYETLTDLFTGIADSIRAKTGSTDSIVADDFPIAIDGIEIGSSIEIPFASPTNFNAVGAGTQISLTWNDPEDMYMEEYLFDTWTKTTLVMSTEHIPTSPSDGTVLVTSTTKNEYSTNPYVIENLEYDITYYFALFSYGENTLVSEAVTTQKILTAYRTMTVIIDQSNSNSSTCCTYANDALEMTAGGSAWDEFFNYKPCLFKDGTVVGYLNPDDYSKFTDGTAADITSGDAGDVMVEFPRMGLNISTSGTTVTISMTDNPNDSNFSYLAHTRGSTAKDYFYIGAYDGYKLSNKLRSLSGKAPTVNRTIGNFRTYAQANGSGYEQWAFYQLTFLQAMYILKYKNLDSQTALGRGYVGDSAAQSTGSTDTKGLCYGSTSTTEHVKLFGIEDFWGNIYTWIDGLFYNSSRQIVTTTDGFNDTGSNYQFTNDSGLSKNTYGYIDKVQGTTQTGFIIKAKAGSSTTYYADYGYLFAGCLPCFGGYWIDGAGAGAFRLYVSYSASDAGSYVGARLMYL